VNGNAAEGRERGASGTSRLLDLLLSPVTFRVMAVTAPFYALAGAFALWRVGPAWLVAWAIFGVAWWFEASLTVCRRCRHYGTWHCMGQGMLVSRLFRRRTDTISRLTLARHALLDLVFFAVPVYGFWRFRPEAAVLAMAWIAIAAVSAWPKGGISYVRPR
jgi:hypothetical protein